VNLERTRHHWGACDRSRDGSERVVAVHDDRDSTGRGGQRRQLERGGRDERQTAERPTQKPAEIVAGHVLHDPSAGFGAPAVGEDVLDADDQIARRSVAHAARTAVVGREQPTDTGRPASKRIQWQPLSFTRQVRVEIGQRDASGRRYREVAGAVIDRLTQRRNRQNRVDARRRRSPIGFSPMTTDDECLPRVIRVTKHVRRLSRVDRLEQPRRRGRVSGHQNRSASPARSTGCAR
jgi:hypothetical protein